MQDKTNDPSSRTNDSLEPDSAQNDPGERRDASRLVSQVAGNIRFLRSQAGMSLGELAQAAEVSKSTLSTLEAGRGNPSIETLWAIATALGVSFGRLVERPAPSVKVVRAGAGATVASGQGALVARLIDSSDRRSTTELYVIEADRATTHHANPHVRGAVEGFFLLSGRMRVGPVGAAVKLEAGDYVSFHADVDHRYEVIRGPARALMVVRYE